MMDPDEILEKLREYYNAWQDDTLTDQDTEEFIQAFDDLDNWIISGGFLPKEWGRPVNERGRR